MLYDDNVTIDDTSRSVQIGAFFVSVGATIDDFITQTRYTSSDFGFGGSTSSPQPDDTVKQMLADIGEFDTAMTATFMSRTKCRDTTLGGSNVINPRPQYCEFDDVAHNITGRVSRGQGRNSFGGYPMGRVYSRAFDDNDVILWLTMGIPVYNRITAFYANAVNDSAATMANQGIAYTVASDIGSLLLAPTAFVMRAPGLAVEWAARLFEYDKQPITRYYDFQGQMPAYYRYVNAMLRKIAVNLGFIDAPDKPFPDQQDSPATNGTAQTAQESVGNPATAAIRGTPDYISHLQLDVGRILMRRMHYQYGAQINLNACATDALLGQKNYQSSIITSFAGTLAQNASAYYENMQNGTDNKSGTTTKQGVVVPDDTTDDTTKGQGNLRTWSDEALDGFKIAAHPSMYIPLTYIGLRVERTHGMTETQSNTYQKSAIESAVNEKIGKAKSGMFDTMYGKFMNFPVVSEIGNAAAGLAAGAADILGLSGVTALLSGAGYLDIPLEWTDSKFSRNYSFRVNLESPGGDTLSILQSVLYPYSFLFCASTPRATGNSSYTSPYLVRAYCKGLMSVPLGAIGQMTVTRGEDAHSLSVDRLPMRMTIDFTIEDLTQNMYMSFDSDTSIKSLLIGNNSNYSEYIDTLTAADINTRYGWEAQRKRWRLFLGGILQYKNSPTMLGMGAGSSTMVRILNAATGLVGPVPHGVAPTTMQPGSNPQ